MQLPYPTVQVRHLLILTEKMLERIEWSHTDLLRALLVFLETQSWMKRNVSGDESGRDPALAELKAAIELIPSQFRNPFEATGVNVSSLQDKIEDAVEYARQYLSLESTPYRGCGTIFTLAQAGVQLTFF